MRICPFRDCTEQLPAWQFACRRHWFSLSPADRRQINDAYASYKNNMIGIEELRDIQRSVLGERGKEAVHA